MNSNLLQCLDRLLNIEGKSHHLESIAVKSIFVEIEDIDLFVLEDARALGLVSGLLDSGVALDFE